MSAINEAVARARVAAALDVFPEMSADDLTSDLCFENGEALRTSGTFGFTAIKVADFRALCADVERLTTENAAWVATVQEYREQCLAIGATLAKAEAEVRGGVPPYVEGTPDPVRLNITEP